MPMNAMEHIERSTAAIFGKVDAIDVERGIARNPFRTSQHNTETNWVELVPERKIRRNNLPNHTTFPSFIGMAGKQCQTETQAPKGFVKSDDTMCPQKSGHLRISLSVVEVDG